MNKVLGIVAILISTTTVMAEEMSTPDRCASYDVEGTCPAVSVSFAELLSQPSKYHGKRIQTVGYLYLEFEHMALYAQRGTSSNGIWIDIENLPLETEADYVRSEKRFRLWQCKYYKQWVIVRGVFDMHPTGHMAPTHPGSMLVERARLRSGKERACKG